MENLGVYMKIALQQRPPGIPGEALRCGADNHPFCPDRRPPENGKNDDGCSQYKSAETKLHDIPPLIRLIVFFFLTNMTFWQVIQSF